ncbi:hypothetical protein [Eggerthella sp. YY7918]|uniref:hypothetical protein n=1 Tax=Eggerthella sp. (strain YY7918) TaxID=502558 RepID=UPI0002D9E7BA|nr:hypothetical protein [Eggerthella sp. YY7918]
MRAALAIAPAKAFLVLAALALALTASVVPASAAHAADLYDVWVGGTQVTSDNASNLVDGMSYDDASKTLTFSKTVTVNGDPNITAGAGIYAGNNSNLTINVEEAVTLTVEGTAKSNSSAGVYVEGSLTVKGKGVLVSSGKATGAIGGMGISAGGNISIEDGVWITASGVGSHTGHGMVAASSVTVSTTGTVEATGSWPSGSASGTNSSGIYANNVQIDNGTVVLSGNKWATGSGTGVVTPTFYPSAWVTASTKADGTDSEQYDPAKIGTYKYLKAEPGHYHPLCGATCGHNPAHPSVLYQPLPAGYTGGELPAGSYYLTGDVDLSKTIEVTSGIVNLCLDGHKLDAHARFGVIQINGIRTLLNVCDGSQAGGGAITGGKADNGGGVYMLDGTLNLFGGSVSNNTAAGSGGGIYASKGALNVFGGSVSNNTAGSGGGVYKDGGVFDLHDGSVSDNVATFEGGGVNVNRSTLRLSGGSVSGNTANNHGGGVNVDEGGVLVLSGGSIEDNIAGYAAAGVFVGERGDMSCFGSPTMANNVIAGANLPSNVWLAANKTISIDGPFAPTAPIGVTTKTKPTATAPVPITMGRSADYSAHFASDEGHGVQNSGSGGSQVVQIVPNLKEIANPDPVTGIANGTSLADIVSDLNDNAIATAKTTGGNYDAKVTWDGSTADPAYDPSKKEEQTFSVEGKVTLPAGIANTESVTEAATISVTVKAKGKPSKPTVDELAIAEVRLSCKDDDAHNKDFPVDAGAMTVGEVQEPTPGTYTCEVVFDGAPYLAQMNAGAALQHRLVKGESPKTITFTYDDFDMRWYPDGHYPSLVDGILVFKVTCANEPGPNLTSDPSDVNGGSSGKTLAKTGDGAMQITALTALVAAAVAAGCAAFATRRRASRRRMR